MTRFFLLALLATLARALVAHACGEMLRLILHHLAPDIPPLVCVAIGLLAGVALVEITVMFWHRRRGSTKGP